MKRKYITYPILFSIMLVLTLGISTNPYKVVSQGSIVKSDIIPSLEINKDGLYKKIQDYSNQYKIEPIDAKVDKVWKAIPWYNGLDVNIEASYKQMKSDGNFDKNKAVYKEIPPNIHLEDLPPEPIYRGNLQKPMVALLINVA